MSADMEPRNLFTELKRRNVYKGRNRVRGDCLAAHSSHHTSRLFELALVLVRLDHVASFIVNANHGIV
jgi:hypothetical protein